ncbi:glycosyltransferase family 2 protein [Candidatus Woesebacteria bacterium]|nr:glycosyltransferase family 2 protein [Candidatus Woesebacteria bacterium]
MKTLSVVLATHNEEKMIEECLKNVYDIADEIIMVDGESDDATVELAKKHDLHHKIKVISTPNLKNFHIMKQQAIEAASGKWIFQIDADERLSEALKLELVHTIQKADAADGYWMPRLNYFLNTPLRKGGQYPDKTLRLYRNGKGRLPCKNIHEQAEVDGTVSELREDLLHYPNPTFSVYIDKWVRYVSLEATRSYKKGLRPSFKNALLYCVWKPKVWFFMTYFRHKGIQDGLAGFVFSLFSALRFVGEYAMVYEMSRNKE